MKLRIKLQHVDNIVEFTNTRYIAIHEPNEFSTMKKMTINVGKTTSQHVATFQFEMIEEFEVTPEENEPFGILTEVWANHPGCDDKTTTYNNATELHWNYQNGALSPHPNLKKIRVAIESNIHRAGLTLDTQYISATYIYRQVSMAAQF